MINLKFTMAGCYGKTFLAAALIALPLSFAASTANAQSASTSAASIIGLSEFPNGGSELTAAVSQFLLANPQRSSEVVAILTTSSREQVQAIGAGFGQAVRIMVQDPSMTLQTQSVLEVVNNISNDTFNAAFSSTTGEIETAAIDQADDAPNPGARSAPVVSRFAIFGATVQNQGTGESVGTPVVASFGAGNNDIGAAFLDLSPSATNSVSPVTP